MATLRVFSGGAPKEIFLQLTPQFEQQTGHKVEYVFAVMSALRDKLAAGEKADVLVMPTNILDDYQKERRGAGARPRHPRARQRQCGGAQRRAEAGSVDAGQGQAGNPEQRAPSSHATPGATPSGTHMGKLIEQFGIADAMKGKIIHRPALEGGVQLVASGEAEIGFYPKSEVVNTDGLTVVGPLPAAIQLTTIYGAAVTDGSASAGCRPRFHRLHDRCGPPRGLGPCRF